MFRLFKKSGFDPQLFEKELTDITESISSTQQQISRLKTRYVSIRRVLIQYMVLIYVAVCLYNYSQIPRNYVASNKIQLFIRGQSRGQLLFVGLYPVMGYLLVKMIHAVFGFLSKNRTHRLKGLKEKHKAKIEELKKITNFNTTANLLNKYGEKNEIPAKNLPKARTTPAKQVPKGPKGPKGSNVINGTTEVNGANIPTVQGRQFQQIPPPNTLKLLTTNPQAPIQKNRPIQDRLLDLLIGSDNNESIENRYALICVNCFTHNGLAPPNCTNPANTKFACLKCGFLNGNTWQDELRDVTAKEESKDATTKEEIREARTTKQSKEAPTTKESKEAPTGKESLIAEKEAPIDPSDPPTDHEYKEPIYLESKEKSDIGSVLNKEETSSNEPNVKDT